MEAIAPPPFDQSVNQVLNQKYDISHFTFAQVFEEHAAATLGRLQNHCQL